MGDGWWWKEGPEEKGEGWLSEDLPGARAAIYIEKCAGARGIIR